MRFDLHSGDMLVDVIIALSCDWIDGGQQAAESSVVVNFTVYKCIRIASNLQFMLVPLIDEPVAMFFQVFNRRSS